MCGLNITYIYAALHLIVQCSMSVSNHFCLNPLSYSVKNYDTNFNTDPRFKNPLVTFMELVENLLVDE